MSVVDAVKVVEMQTGTFVMLSPVHELMEMDVVAEKQELMMVEDSRTVDSNVLDASLRSTGTTRSVEAAPSSNRMMYLEAMLDLCCLHNVLTSKEELASRMRMLKPYATCRAFAGMKISIKGGMSQEIVRPGG